MKPREESNKTN